MKDLKVYDGTVNYYNCIYLYVNNINNKKYVGKAKDLKQRHEQHLRRDLIIDKAIRKYGMENFTLYVIVSSLKDEEIDEYERFYIKEYNTIKNGYNISEGGTGGNVQIGWTPERKEEFKKKMSEISKKQNGWAGQKADENLRKKLSESHKGLTYSTHRTTLAQYGLNGNLIKVWYGESVTNVALTLNISEKGIYHNLKGKNKSCGGFMWRRVENDEEPLKNIPPCKREKSGRKNKLRV